MAACPRCGKHLSIWDIKAECPYCGVNIPNYNWEGRLDEDAENAKKAWASFRITTGNIKSSLFGSKLRIIRFACTFLPLVALVLPAVNASFNIPFVNSSGGSISMLTFVLDYIVSNNILSLAGMAGLEGVGTGVIMLGVAIALMFAAVIFGVLNFVFVLVNSFKLKAGSNIVLNTLAAVCFAAAAVLAAVSLAGFADSSVNLLSGSVGIAYPVGTALFLLNTVLSVIVNRGMKRQRLQAGE